MYSLPKIHTVLNIKYKRKKTEWTRQGLGFGNKKNLKNKGKFQKILSKTYGEVKLKLKLNYYMALRLKKGNDKHWRVK